MRIDNSISKNAQQQVDRLDAKNQDIVKSLEENENTQGKDITTESENILDKKITAVSKDGDTLEISTDKGTTGKMIKIIPDASLTKYSKPQLQKMLKEKRITKQQYEKAIKGK